MRRTDAARRDLWARHDSAWRHPAQAISRWREVDRVERSLLAGTARGAWWDVIEETGATLLVTREYEHLLMAFSAPRGRPQVSYWPMPHPSGLAVDRRSQTVFVASTRNPNQVYRFVPITSLLLRHDAPRADVGDPVLAPVSTSIYPGCLYLHDLAIVGGKLFGNAVGQNAVASLAEHGQHRLVWWPRSVDRRTGPLTTRNHLQLNSIAAGPTLRASFFSASTELVSRRRPGHKNFPVDGRGVIFSGRTREPIARGLTRPHSARLHRGRIWVDNSGYGEIAVVEGGGCVPAARLPGWTRGLAFHGRIAFVGTSRVIPEFRRYAPGLDAARSVCGVHAVDTGSGRVLGSWIWPAGNQIFAVEWVAGTIRLPLGFRGTRSVEPRRLFYSFSTERPS